VIEYAKYDFVRFDDHTNPGEKTKIWFVWAKPSVPAMLGIIAFRPVAKKYVFASSGDAVFDAGMLDEIRSFLVTQTTLWMVELVKEEKV
jgi:hypothetical protein